MWELRTDLLKGHSRAGGLLEETPSYPKGKILPRALSALLLNIYEENWVEVIMDDGGRPTGLDKEGEMKVGSPGLSGRTSVR